MEFGRVQDKIKFWMNRQSLGNQMLGRLCGGGEKA